MKPPSYLITLVLFAAIFSGTLIFQQWRHPQQQKKSIDTIDNNTTATTSQSSKRNNNSKHDSQNSRLVLPANERLHDANLQAAEGAVKRLRDPLERQFRLWGQSDLDFELAINAVYEWKVRMGDLALGQIGKPNRVKAGDLAQSPELARISSEFHDELIAITGSIDRAERIRRMIVDSDLSHSITDRGQRDKERRVQGEEMKDRMRTIRDELGPDYRQILTKRYGEEVADTMLRFDQ
jgi:hypothetical protein